MTDAPAPPSVGRRVVDGLTYAVLLVLAFQVTVAAAVLLLWRPGGVAVPIGVLVAALVGPLCWQGASLLRHRWGAAGPGLVWLGTALQMMYQRREGDLFVTSNGLKGYGFLVVGTLSAAIAIGGWVLGASPGALLRRSTPRGGVPAG